MKRLTGLIAKCIDVDETYGTTKGLLTLNKEYPILGELGGYFEIRCDDGKVYTKTKTRFIVLNKR